MFDCSKEISGYHNDEVRLPGSERTAMRDRRDSNRKRVRDGLEKNEKPNPRDFCSQGSYQMKTMVQHPDNDYDIDDGVYFEKEDLKGSQGAYLSALAARQMVRDAVDDGGFKTPPETRKNCVRVSYQKGYHVDLPVYRRVVIKDLLGQEEVFYELASADWLRSDARDVTAWFDKVNKSLSPDETNDPQFRRITRLLKKFATSRSSWKGQIASGFMITKLASECYQANAGREDRALYETMKSIRDRLDIDLVVRHPVTPDATISKGDADPKARLFKEKLSEALTTLDVLFENDCDKEKAMKAWDKVFNTTYFTNQFGTGDDDTDDAERLDTLRKAAAAVSQPTKPWVS